MRFLVDNALPPLLADLLRGDGHDAVHVRELGMQAAADPDVLALALAQDRALLSADTDFGQILAEQGASRPSFILFRHPNAFVAADYFRLLAMVLPLIESDLQAGCVAVIRDGKIRVRRLPFA